MAQARGRAAGAAETAALAAEVAIVAPDRAGLACAAALAAAARIIAPAHVRAAAARAVAAGCLPPAV